MSYICATLLENFVQCLHSVYTVYMRLAAYQHVVM